ncbi:MAG: FKBP-type peptidyl-prolyl cis-trans isomerase, partial [Gammaproteobacteria bacterium]|nr:FKBP-type peptidyl-prolyl cis-trans isomerase [Gammaproteobacteria bacterium]NNJ71857.1 peptidylprolyl isomerase [Enterobacterales bacterium]
MTNTVMGFHYTLKDGAGEVLDTSDGGNPLLFMIGAGHIIPGLETEIVDLAVGDKKNVEVKAEQAYGEIIDELQLTVARNQFPEDAVLNVGDQFKTSNEPT